MFIAKIFLLAVSFLPLQAQPDQSVLYFNQGVELQRQGDYQGAQQAYEKSLALNPQRIEAHANLGLVYLQLGAPDKAIPSLSKALTGKSEATAVRMYLGLAYFRAGQVEAAERELQLTTKQQPGNAQAQHLYGLCLLKLNRQRKRLTHWNNPSGANRTTRPRTCCWRECMPGSTALPTWHVNRPSFAASRRKSRSAMCAVIKAMAPKK